MVKNKFAKNLIEKYGGIENAKKELRWQAALEHNSELEKLQNTLDVLREQVNTGKLYCKQKENKIKEFEYQIKEMAGKIQDAYKKLAEYSERAAELEEKIKGSRTEIEAGNTPNIEAVPEVKRVFYQPNRWVVFEG